MNYYDQFAEDFEKIPFGELVKDLFNKYATPNNHVLDIGSGPGNFALWIHRKGYNITCLDPSPEMIRRCQQKGLNTIHSTLHNLETDQQFQIVLALSSLIHIPKKDFSNHLNKIYHLLKPSGIIFISMLIGNGEGFEDPLNKGLKRYFSYFQHDELERIFTEENLTILESIKVNIPKMDKIFEIYVLKR